MNLRFHNICWSRRYAVWCRYAGGGWWGRGSVVSPEMRGFYEKFLPFNEFKHSLITIGEQILESPDWVPNILRSNDILSLPDFWAMLPDAFAGRVTFTEDELFPLFCAIALHSCNKLAISSKERGKAGRSAFSISAAASGWARMNLRKSPPPLEEAPSVSRPNIWKSGWQVIAVCRMTPPANGFSAAIRKTFPLHLVMVSQNPTATVRNTMSLSAMDLQADASSTPPRS